VRTENCYLWRMREKSVSGYGRKSDSFGSQHNQHSYLKISQPQRGRASYRGLVKIAKGAKGSKSHVRCDALLLDDKSRSDTYPVNDVQEQDVTLGHEASVSKVGEEQLFI